jgi:hypothetical protein
MWFHETDEPIDWEETIEKVATKISRLGLEVPAILMLEAHKPLTFFANQGLIFLSPILYPLFGGKTERAAKFFEERKNVEALITRIEQKADDRAQQERAVRQLRRAARREMRQARLERKQRQDGTWRKL